MKDEIFRLLKQAYSPLGLGDAFLLARAEMLDSLGFVTAENVGDVVAKQKASLEAAQRANDARVTDAIKKHDDDLKKKADEEAKKKAEDDAKKAAAEAAKKAEEERKKAEEEAKKKGGLSDELKAYLDELEKKHQKELTDQKAAYEANIKTLNDSVQALKDNHDAQEKARQKAEHAAKILSKAKELGIPQSRIDEGFLIAEDASDEQIGTYLGTVKKNIDASQLPGSRHFALGSENPTDAEIKEIADALVS